MYSEYSKIKENLKKKKKKGRNLDDDTPNVFNKCTRGIHSLPCRATESVKINIQNSTNNRNLSAAKNVETCDKFVGFLFDVR